MKDNIKKIYCNVMTPELVEQFYKENGILMIGNPRQNILNLDTEYAESFADALNECPKGKYMEVIFNINDYDLDSREVYEIPEVVKYIITVFDHKPQLFFYLIPDSKRIILLCYCIKRVTDRNAINTNIECDATKIQQFVTRMINVVDNMKNLNDDDKERFANEIYGLLGIGR